MTPEEINVLIKGTFGTELGKRMLNHLKKTFVDRDIYVKGQTYEETSYREGQRNVILQLIKEMSK